jgi:hypothetical protein
MNKNKKKKVHLANCSNTCQWKNGKQSSLFEKNKKKQNMLKFLKSKKKKSYDNCPFNA